MLDNQNRIPLTSPLKGIVVESLKKHRLIHLIYLVQLSIGLIIGLQVYHVLEASFGQSMASQGLLDGFDRTIFTDLFNYHGGSLSPLFGILRWIVLLYIPVYLFLQSGLLYIIVKERNDFVSFFTGSAKYFKRISGLSLFYFLIAIVTTAIIWGLFFGILGTPLDGMLTEKPWFHKLLFTAVIWVLILISFWLPFFYAKTLSISRNLGFFNALKEGVKKAHRSRIHLFGWILLLMGIQVLIIILGNYISEDRGAFSWFLIGLIFLAQQGLIWFRVFLKVLFYNGLYRYGKR